MWNFKKYIKQPAAAPLLCLLALLAFNGCVAGEQETPPVPKVPTEVELALAIDIRSADNPMNRADYELDKTPEECKITSVSIFLVPVTQVAGVYVEDWTTAQYRMEYYPEVVSGYYNLSFTLKAPAGKKHLYAAANMSQAQTLAFMDTNGAYRSTATTYKTVIDEFANPSATGKGIVMITPTMLSTGSNPVNYEIDFSGSGERTLQTNPIELKRVVSKVLMVCQTNNTITGAVGGVDYGITTGNSAWIRLSEVYFGLNPTGSVLFRNEDTALDQFVTITIPPSLPPTTDEWMNTLKYEANRIGNPVSDDHYTEGLYCLANKISASGADASTKLTVRVKYTPHTLVTNYAGTLPTLNVYATESAAWAALAAPSGQKDENGNNISYPDGTFWKLGDNFYTYNGMMATIANAPITEGIKRADFLPYLAGIGYYEVEIDASRDLLRNFYYLLTVTEFGTPKHVLTEPGDGEMMVNSQKMEWIPKGIDSVIVKPE